MSSKGQLLEAVRTYMRELHGQPDKKQLKERLEELRREIKGQPDPSPTETSPPPPRGETVPDEPKAKPGSGQTVSVSWPDKGEVQIRLGG
jgi:hypothetical protein